MGVIESGKIRIFEEKKKIYDDDYIGVKKKIKIYWNIFE